MQSQKFVLGLLLGGIFLGGSLVGCADQVGTTTTETTQAVSSDHVSDAVILQWNQIAVTTIGAKPPFPSTRFMAITQLAVFEAVNACTRKYEPYLGTVTAPDGASPEAAAIAAAHDTLKALFPAAAANLDTQEAISLAALPDSQAKTDGIAVGQAAAVAMIANRTGDGSTPPAFFVPPNSNPGIWQTTPSCSPSGGAFFHWQNVKPFGVDSASQFRADAPPTLPSRAYAAGYNESQAVGDINSANRPQDRTDVAKVYAAQPPHVGWNSMARQLAGERHDNISRTARIFALMNMSLSDGHVTVFESKYYYNLWRPETAIPRGAEDNNARTTASAYQPLIVTPCFPSYPAAHGIGAGTASQVLRHFYGNGDHNLTNSTPNVPGVVLTYTKIEDIVKDVSDARVFGGIHFRYDLDEAEKMGRKIGRFNIQHWLERDHGHSQDYGNDEDDGEDGED